MQDLSALFIFQEARRMGIENVLFPSRVSFPKLQIRVPEGRFYCVHKIRLSEPTKLGSLKLDHVSGYIVLLKLSAFGLFVLILGKPPSYSKQLVAML